MSSASSTQDPPRNAPPSPESPAPRGVVSSTTQPSSSPITTTTTTVKREKLTEEEEEEASRLLLQQQQELLLKTASTGATPSTSLAFAHENNNNNGLHLTSTATATTIAPSPSKPASLVRVSSIQSSNSSTTGGGGAPTTAAATLSNMGTPQRRTNTHHSSAPLSAESTTQRSPSTRNPSEGKESDSTLEDDDEDDEDDEDERRSQTPSSSSFDLSDIKFGMRSNSKMPWTSEEDRILAEAVKLHNGRSWKLVARMLPGRTHSQAAHRWQKVLDPTLRKGAWTDGEDNQLLMAVQQVGEGHWSRVAEFVATRNGKQCRERWRNQISPQVDRRPWSEEEDNKILELVASKGQKWSEIAREMPGRTENAVKNRWNARLGKNVEVVPSGWMPNSTGISTPSATNNVNAASSSSVVIAAPSPSSSVGGPTSTPTCRRRLSQDRSAQRRKRAAESTTTTTTTASNILNSLGVSSPHPSSSPFSMSTTNNMTSPGPTKLNGAFGLHSSGMRSSPAPTMRLVAFSPPPSSASSTGAGRRPFDVTTASASAKRVAYDLKHSPLPGEDMDAAAMALFSLRGSSPAQSFKQGV